MKMEIELTESQAEKVEILKDNGIGVGEAIDILFDIRDDVINSSDRYIDGKIEMANKQKAELKEQMAKVDEELTLYTKLKDSTVNPEQKIKIIEKEYGKMDKSYDETVHDAKLKFKWRKSIFKF